MVEVANVRWRDVEVAWWRSGASKGMGSGEVEKEGVWAEDWKRM